MPLMKSKSKSAFTSNLKAEMSAGKPQKQALAIAYAVKRKARMAKGGMVEAEPLLDTDSDEPNELLGSDSDQLPSGDEDFLTNEDAPGLGEVTGNELGDEDQMQDRKGILQKIMSRRRP